jgi:electron transfer flavoprotein alpha subunit
MTKEIWVLSEKESLQAELLGAARFLAEGLGGTTAALVIGAAGRSEAAFRQGADKVYRLSETAEYTLEDFLPSLVQAVQQYQPAAVLLGATWSGKALAGRLAAVLHRSVVTDVKKFAVQHGQIEATHLILGGGAVRVERTLAEPLIATLGLGVFEALPVRAEAKGEVVALSFVQPQTRWVLRERKPKPPASVNLAAAKKVVCPGRGVQKQEDLQMMFELAQLLGAEVGATRPLCEGLDWLPRERYIGVSGAFVKPDLYLGIGVSGQVQHTVGITQSRVVAAINKDEEAPIFQQSDYGIVGDLYQIVPALIRALQARR